MSTTTDFDRELWKLWEAAISDDSITLKEFQETVKNAIQKHIIGEYLISGEQAFLRGYNLSKQEERQALWGTKS